MDEFDPIIESLHSLGREPVDPAVATDHLSQMVGVRPRSTLATKIKIGAAFGAGLILGGSGLAAAGALPAPAQQAAHSVFSTVGVGVPSDTAAPPQRYNGPECGGTYKNHGQYVRSHHQDPNAGRSPCGKPIQATTGTGSGDESEPPENPSGAPPSSAHGHGKGQGHGQSGDQSDSPGGTGSSNSAQAPVAPTPPTTTTPPTPTSTSTATNPPSATSTTTSAA